MPATTVDSDTITAWAEPSAGTQHCSGVQSSGGPYDTGCQHQAEEGVTAMSHTTTQLPGRMPLKPVAQDAGGQ